MKEGYPKAMASRNVYKPGFMISKNRLAKAEKIEQVLKEAHEVMQKLPYRQTLLDIGTGNGAIAGYLSESYDVTSLDITDQRTVHEGYRFIQIESERLPFSNNSFDLVVSNHVIEHVPDAGLHLSEIFRVLKPGGLVYLATPNRLWPYEVHNKTYFLHYLPPGTFNSILKRLGKYHEDVFLLSWKELQKMASGLFRIETVSDKICRNPKKYKMKCRPLIAKLLSMIPLQVYKLLTFMHPTLIVVLQKNELKNHTSLKIASRAKYIND